jgi:hypothetical protein
MKKFKSLSFLLVLLILFSTVPAYALDYSIAEVTGTNTITLQGEDLQEWLKENQGVRNSKVEKKSGIFEKAWMFVKDFVLPNEASAFVDTNGMILRSGGGGGGGGDTTPPVITINPYPTEPTNQDITVTASVNEGTLNAESHTFTENGSFEFTAIDDAGNISSVVVTITNIDKEAPIITIGEYNTTPTQEYVYVGGYNFNINKRTLFDGVGYTVSWDIYVNNVFIDSYSIHSLSAQLSNPTYKNLQVIEESNGFLCTYTIYWPEFYVYGMPTIPVSRLLTKSTIEQKTSPTTEYISDSPVITINPDEPTNQDITVTASVNEGTLNAESHTFTENGSFEFIATDAAGNESRKTVTITNIDKVAPKITIGEYNTEPTNQDITVTASVNKGTLNATSHTFTENGSFEFTAIDDAGNISSVVVPITNIDKEAPIITIGEYNTEPTNQDITVTASVNEGSLNAESHTFTENGSFEFIATDAAGNESRKTVTITNIDKTDPDAPTLQADKTAPTNTDVTVTITYSADSTVKQYKIGSGNWTNYTGPVVLSENATVYAKGQDEAGNWSTEASLEVSNIDKDVPDAPILQADKETKKRFSNRRKSNEKGKQFLASEKSKSQSLYAAA